MKALSLNFFADFSSGSLNPVSWFKRRNDIDPEDEDQVRFQANIWFYFMLMGL